MRPGAAETLSTPEEGIRWPRRPARPGPAARRAHHLRRQGPGHGVPADRAAAPARRARRTSWWSCSTTSGSARRARSAARAQTPNAERLAAGGLKYNRFHTTALCSPTRAALLTGRNHHTVGMGGITEIATSAPGYNSIRPEHLRAARRDLKLNGYSTAQFGKCHEVPVWETSPMGPFDHWPTGGGGFEYFYGFIGGETQPVLPGALRGHDAGRAVSGRPRRATTSSRTWPTRRSTGSASRSR